MPRKIGDSAILTLYSPLEIIDKKYPQSEWILNKYQQNKDKVSYCFEYRNFKKRDNFEKWKELHAKTFEDILIKIENLCKKQKKK
jgi:DNA-directed RNA polymerase alpha subunit